MTRDRGKAAAMALLRVEVTVDDPTLMAEAEAEFERLGSIEPARHVV